MRTGVEILKADNPATKIKRFEDIKAKVLRLKCKVNYMWLLI